MSAFMVSTVHIDAMLTAGLVLGPAYGTPLSWYWPDLDATTDRGSWTSEQLRQEAVQRRRELTLATAGRVGAMLLAENRRSVDHRYAEEELEEPYLYSRVPGRPDPVVVLKAIACYEYQSCEHPGWRTSEAHAFVRVLESAMVHHLPGYENAPWEITSRAVFLSAHGPR